MCTLKEALALSEDSDTLVFAVARDGGDPIEVEFIDDYGIGSRNAEFFVAGFEHGPHVLIHANGFEAAWETWIDTLPTIPADELIEAYGIVDDYRAEYEALGGPGGPCPPYHERAAWDAWHDRFKAACVTRLQALGETENPPELIEGYEYQSNASGTGIVDVGHYAWMNEIDPSEITIRAKTEEEIKAEQAKKAEAKKEAEAAKNAQPA